MSSPSLDDDHVSRLMSLLGEHWVLTLATSDPSEPSAPPHCAPLFYALRTAEDGAPELLFTSKPTSLHGEHLGAGPSAAGAAIYLETETVGQLRGVQMRGPVERLDPDHPQLESVRERYIERHPIAKDMLEGDTHRLYVMRVQWAKLTDNRLGFGVHPTVEFGAVRKA